MPREGAGVGPDGWAAGPRAFFCDEERPVVGIERGGRGVPRPEADRRQPFRLRWPTMNRVPPGASPAASRCVRPVPASGIEGGPRLQVRDFSHEPLVRRAARDLLRMVTQNLRPSFLPETPVECGLGHGAAERITRSALDGPGRAPGGSEQNGEVLEVARHHRVAVVGEQGEVGVDDVGQARCGTQLSHPP
jgi:hypothetical protein